MKYPLDAEKSALKAELRIGKKMDAEVRFAWCKSLIPLINIAYENGLNLGPNPGDLVKGYKSLYSEDLSETMALLLSRLNILRKDAYEIGIRDRNAKAAASPRKAGVEA